MTRGLGDVTRQEREHAKRTALFLSAKGKFARSLTLRFITVIAGIVAPLFWPGSPYVPVMLVAGLIAAEFYSYRSESIRGVGEQVARALDYHDGLGWTIKEGPRLAAAALVSTRQIEAIVAQHREAGRQYFDTPAEVGPARAVQNVKQSAWYTSQQVRGLRDLMWVLVMGTAGLAVVYFLMALSPVLGGGAQDTAAAYATVLKTSSGLITASISLGIVRLAVGYDRAHQAAQRHYELAVDYQKSASELSEKDAVFLLASYHAARASMPLVPEWWWQRHERRLNVLWRQEVLEEA